MAPSSPLPHRQRHDAADIVVQRAPLLLGEVADEPRSSFIRFGHNVEEEGLDVVVERLMIEEHLGEQAEVLTVDLGESVLSRRVEGT